MQNKRNIVRAEFKAKDVLSRDGFYIAGVDVARTRAETAITILKVIPKENFYQVKVVNIFTILDATFLEQSVFLKKLYRDFNLKELVIDGNGLGVGLLDFLILENQCPDTGETYGPLGIFNNADYKKKQPRDCPQVVYVIKTGSGELSSNIHVNLMSMTNSGRVHFLLNEAGAKNYLNSTKKGQDMDIDDKIKWMRPYTNTTKLIRQTTNLKRKDGAGTSAAKVILEKISRGMEKDLFSALEYGLWRIKELEEEYYRKRKRRGNIRNFVMCT